MVSLNVFSPRRSGAPGPLTSRDVVRFCLKVRIDQISYKNLTNSADVPFMTISLVITQPSIQLANHLQGFYLTTKLGLRTWDKSLPLLSYISCPKSPHHVL